MTTLNASQMSDKYREEDEAAPVILVDQHHRSGVCGGARSSPTCRASMILAASAKAWHIGLAGLTVLSSWTLIPTMFTTHYADMYYSVGDDDRPLQFPDKRAPVFWDFAYFSFTIAAACQTADVATSQGPIRKVVIAHSVLSFFFNASILGFAINVMAGLIGH